jgi:hypothetical protein
MADKLNVEVHILFYEENSCTVTLRQMDLRILKDHGHAYKLHSNNFFLTKFLNLVVVTNFKIMLGQTVNYSV